MPVLMERQELMRRPPQQARVGSVAWVALVALMRGLQQAAPAVMVVTAGMPWGRPTVAMAGSVVLAAMRRQAAPSPQKVGQVALAATAAAPAPTARQVTRVMRVVQGL
jgi:hypothetical protein